MEALRQGLPYDARRVNAENLLLDAAVDASENAESRRMQLSQKTGVLTRSSNADLDNRLPAIRSSRQEFSVMKSPQASTRQAHSPDNDSVYMQ